MREWEEKLVLKNACFINTPEEIYDIQNNLNNWGITYPYNVKSIIRNMIYD